jgi:Putative addiction module component
MKMSMPVEALEAEFLRLPTPDRIRLLDRVIASLDADMTRDKAWARLAVQRQAEIDDGSAVLIDGSEFMEKLRAELS